MKFISALSRWSVVVFMFFLANALTVSPGGEVSSVTVVNKTEYLIDVLAEGDSYLSILPDYSIVHTTDPKPSIDVTARYSPGQEVSGSVTRTILLPYSAPDRACRCEEGSPTECVYIPEGGGSVRWDVRSSDFSDTVEVPHGEGTVWLNNELIAHHVPVLSPDYYEDFCINGLNWSGGGTSTFYIDDVTLHVVPVLQLTDDFENYVAGTHPTTWTTRFSGSSGLISGAVSHSAGQSFQIVSLPNWARVEALELPSVGDSVVYGAWIYIDQYGKGMQIGLGKPVSSNTYLSYNVVTFDNSQFIRFSGADTTVNLGSWTPQTWYQVRVRCDYSTLTRRRVNASFAGF